MITSVYTSKKVALPNIKFKKRVKSPDYPRFMTPDSHNALVKKLSESSNDKIYKSVDSSFRPGSIDLTSRNERIVDQTFSARVDVGDPSPIRKICQDVPTLKFGNVIMSKDLAVMAQVRRSLIGEISNSRIQNLTIENLPIIRNSFCPKELQNTGDSLQLVQKTKAVSERRARHPFATGAYAIKALNSRAQKQIIDKLQVSLPEGSRFLRYL